MNKAVVPLFVICFFLASIFIVHADNTNLAVIPDDWDLIYGSGYQIIKFDTNVTLNGQPSIRLEKHVDGNDSNTARECDGIWYSVSIGDHIYASCYMKTTPSGFNDTNPYSGARFGFDLYFHNATAHYLLGLDGDGYNPLGTETEEEMYVHWNTSSWSQRTVEFIIPATYFNYDMLTQEYIVPVQANQFVMWLQVWSSTYYASDDGYGWFSNAELYINPEEEPTPSPSPTPSPTPTPHPTTTPHQSSSTNNMSSVFVPIIELGVLAVAIGFVKKVTKIGN